VACYTKASRRVEVPFASKGVSRSIRSCGTALKSQGYLFSKGLHAGQRPCGQARNVCKSGCPKWSFKECFSDEVFESTARLRIGRLGGGLIGGP